MPPAPSDSVLPVEAKAKGGAGDASVAGPPGPGPEDGPASFKLIEPGAEPRVVRRYAFVSGKSETRVGQVSETLTVQTPGAAPRQWSEPVFDVTMRLSTTGDGGSGVFPFGVTVEKVALAPGHGLDPRSEAEAWGRLPPLLGVAAKVDVTARGQFGELTVVGDERGAKPGTADVIDRLGRMLELMVVPFPEEPIGVGARWEVSSADVLQGGEHTSVNRFLLKEWTGDVGTVTQDVVFRMRPQDPSPPGTSWTITGKGQYTFLVKLDRPIQKMWGEVSAVSARDAPQGQSPPRTPSVRAIKTRHRLETPAGH